MKCGNNTKNLIILWLLTLGSCLFIFRPFIFGGNFLVFNDVGSDTAQQYLMQYNAIVNLLRKGDFSLWDFKNGFGTSLFAQNPFHPLLMLLYLAGTVLGPARLPALMVYFVIGEIMLAVTAAYAFVRIFGWSDRSVLLAAYFYGFNGYLIVWGQHYQFGLFVILLPLLLLCLEQALRSKKFNPWLAVITAVTVCSSVYMSYMCLLMAGMYLIFRLLSMENSDFKTGILQLLLHGMTMVLGLGVAMVLFLPNAFYIFGNSARMGSADSIGTRIIKAVIKPYGNTWNYTAFCRLFSSNLTGISDNYTGSINYYEAPSLFMGIPSLFLFVQYLCTIHRQKSTRFLKGLQYTGIALCALMIFTKVGSLPFNAFAYPFSRHTFLFMPLGLLVTAYMLDQIFIKKQFSLPGCLISLGGLGILCWLTYPGTPQASTLMICCVGVITLILLYLASHILTRKFTCVVTVLLFLVSIFHMSYDSYHSYNGRDTLSKENAQYFEDLYGADISQALTYLEETDTSFYRVEKDFVAASYCLDSLAQDYYPVSTYNSAPNKNLLEFTTKLWPNLKRMNNSEFSFQQTISDTAMASLTNVKYLLSRNPNLKLSGFSQLEQFGSLYIYKNNNTHSLGKFYTKTMSSKDFSADNPAVDRDALLADTLLLDIPDPGNSLTEDYPLENLNLKIEDVSFKKCSEKVIPLDTSQYTGYQRLYLSFDVTLKKNEVCSINFENLPPHYIKAKKGERISLRFPLDPTNEWFKINSSQALISGTISNIQIWGSKEPIDYTPKASVDFPSPDISSRVTGSVSNETEGYLFLTIPYENGWKAEVDGEEQNILRANYGFCALELPPGTHSITLSYTPPGLVPGAIISILSLLLLAVVWVMQKRKAVKKLP